MAASGTSLADQIASFSAIANFERRLQVMSERRVVLTLAAMPAPVRERLTKSLRPGARFEDTLDHALEACELDTSSKLMKIIDKTKA